MRDVINEAERIAAIANNTANIGYLLVVALVVLILAAIGVVWMRGRINRLPAKQRRSEASARTGGDPVEDFIENALRYEADQQWLRRGGHREDGSR